MLMFVVSAVVTRVVIEDAHVSGIRSFLRFLWFSILTSFDLTEPFGLYD